MQWPKPEGARIEWETWDGSKEYSRALAMLLVLGGLGGVFPVTIAHAATAGRLQNTLNTFQSGTGSLSAAVTGSTVTVTGNITGATGKLTLNIDEAVTVVWRATLDGTTTGIELEGRGAFRMESGKISGSSAGAIISSSKASVYVPITIAGGVVQQNGSGQALYSTGGGTLVVAKYAGGTNG